MKKLLLLLTILALLFPVMAHAGHQDAGDAHYVDCSGSDGDGSFATPWNNINSVNSHSFSSGEDVYFKKNIVCTYTSVNDQLVIDWTGTAANRVWVGCYEAENDFDCGLTPGSPTSRATLDGDNNQYPGGTEATKYRAMIKVDGDAYDYITIEDFYVKDSGASGIRVENADYVDIINNYLENMLNNAILVAYSHDFNVTGNYTVDSCTYSSSAAITITDNYGTEDTYNGLVSGNWVTGGHEGIGIYKRSKNIIVEKNVVWDNNPVNIYVGGNSYNITVRYNEVYSTQGYLTYYGIMSYCETSQCDDLETTCAEAKIYGNLIAGVKQGIYVGASSSCPAYGFYSDNNLIYANTIVDSIDYNFRTKNTGSGNEFKNNKSWILSGGAHVNAASPSGVTFTHNHYNTDPGGNANDNAVIDTISLEKSSGWQTLAEGELDGSEFTPTSADKGINAGIKIVSYNNRITASGYDDSPITVTVADGGDPPEIGAWDFTTDSTAPVFTETTQDLFPCSSDPRTITLAGTTDEPATCKWHDSDVVYDSMSNTFDGVGTQSHSDTTGSLACDASYTKYVRCKDALENKASSSVSVNFTISAGASVGQVLAIGAGSQSIKSIGSGSQTLYLEQ